ncbi:CPXV031 protein [Cowpox virus]|nr:CPXV031 protein [Cowpox virus]ATB55070.1 CPXV031 protein [Cowpox virus]ATB55292.1 CPXV031 protein [Cowpox virus]ATB55507.1 CPXV031 protein [Cowpox virus]ATB55721.1 CPXV031 protein [Cowpox virus]
MQIQYVIVVTR